MKKVLSLLLALCLLAGCLPMAASAAGSAADLAAVARQQQGGKGWEDYCTWFYGKKQHASWCAIFVSYCANKAGISTNIIPKNATVAGMYAGIKNGGGKEVSSPQAGDIVFYKQSSFIHVGIMVDSKNSWQGNIGGKVANNFPVTSYKAGDGTKNYSITYLRPNYGGTPPPITDSVTVTTGRAEEITSNSALLRGTVTGSTKPSEVGIYWGVSREQQVILGSRVPSGNSPWSFSFRMADYGKTLVAGTTYYYRAYAVVNGKTVWGNFESFKTVSANTTVITGVAEGITNTDAVLRTSVTSNIKPSEVGIYWGVSREQQVVLGSRVPSGNSPWSFNFRMADYGKTLVAGTTYYYRAYAVVNGKTIWGNFESFKTAAVDVPAISGSATDITKTTVALHAMVYTENGKIEEAGMYFGTSRNNLSLLGSNKTNGESAVTLEYTVGKNGQPLTEGTTYYFQAYAKVNGKEYRGEVVPFTTDLGDSKFADVKVGQYYYDAVSWAVDNGITSGTDKTHFSPNASCTRAQAVTFLWRAAGEPEPAGTAASFKDVKAGSYYEKAVQWAVEQNITGGTGNGKFSPETACSRAQIVTFLWRKEGSPETSGSAFSDVKAGEYYETAVKWAVANEITGGTGNGKFSPDARCARGQIVTFLYRYAN